MPQPAVDLIRESFVKLDHMLGRPRRRLAFLEHALNVESEEMTNMTAEAEAADTAAISMTGSDPHEHRSNPDNKQPLPALFNFIFYPLLISVRIGYTDRPPSRGLRSL